MGILALFGPTRLSVAALSCTAQLPVLLVVAVMLIGEDSTVAPGLAAGKLTFAAESEKDEVSFTVAVTVRFSAAAGGLASSRRRAKPVIARSKPRTGRATETDLTISATSRLIVFLVEASIAQQGSRVNM